MQLRCLRDRRQFTVSENSTLGKGGEAQVYAVDRDALWTLGPSLAAKIYEPGKERQERALKLLVMRDHPPILPNGPDGHTPVAWPIDLLCDNSGSVVGFLMPRVHNASQIIDFYNPKTRLENCPLFDYRYLLRTARNLAAAVRVLHARGYIIGDLKHSNVLVTNTALVTLVDTDSFQVTDPQTGHIYGCPVRTPDFTPPELQGQKPEGQALCVSHDLFALGVLIFHLLMEGTHPFAGVYEGEGDPPAFEERIAAGHFPYGSRPKPYHPSTRHAPAFGMLPPGIQQLFLQCFEQGHTQPDLRPDATHWQHALDEAMQSLHRCGVNAQHFYSNHLSVCPWCERKTKQLRGIDPFPSEQAILNRIPIIPTIPTAPVQADYALSKDASGYIPLSVTTYPKKSKSFVPARVGIGIGIIALLGCLSQISNQPSITQDVSINSEQNMLPPTVNTPTTEEAPLLKPAENTSLSAPPAATAETDSVQLSRTPNAISANGQYLAFTAKSDHPDSIRIWDLKSGKGLPNLSHSTDVTALDFSATGSLLAIGGKNGVEIFRVATGEHLHTLSTNTPIRALSFSPDGTRIAYVTADMSANYLSGYANSNRIQVALMDFNANHFLLQPALKADSNETVNSLRYSPDGKWLAASSTLRLPSSFGSAEAARPQLQARTTLWEVDSGKRGIQIASNPYSMLAFSPYGEKLALGGTTLEVYSTQTGARLNAFAQLGSLSGLCFAADGSCLTALEYISTSPSVQEYHLDTPQSGETTTVIPIQTNGTWLPWAQLVDSNTIVGFDRELTTVHVFHRPTDGGSFLGPTE